MTPLQVLAIITIYFAFLILLARLTSGKGDSASFFRANKNSPWYLVAFGMIGASLSGVTFISVPGWVGSTEFGYMQMVMGYVPGYLFIALVLMPIYYRLNLTSIYTYLEDRFGISSYKSGAAFFLLSRTLGASARLFLVASVLQLALFNAWGVPFGLTVAITIILIWIYTFRGGIKTIVWTDTLQTTFMLLAVCICVWVISKELQIDLSGLPTFIADSDMSKVFHWEMNSPQNFFKQFLSGAFIAIAMTGLDQDMMQKNLTIRSLKEAQKNIYWLSFSLIFVNLLFLSLGVLLYQYAQSKGIALPAKSDDLFPLLSLNHFPPIAGIFFVLGLIAAAYSSADSALTSLTTSFCIDFLDFEKKEDEKEKKKTRLRVHIAFSVILFLVIILFRLLNDTNVISAVFKIAGYTYGPLLGLFVFGIFTKWKIKDKLVPYIVIAAPILTFIIDTFSAQLLGGFKLGFATLILNGALTFIGLYLLRK